MLTYIQGDQVHEWVEAQVTWLMEHLCNRANSNKEYLYDTIIDWFSDTNTDTIKQSTILRPTKCTKGNWMTMWQNLRAWPNRQIITWLRTLLLRFLLKGWIQDQPSPSSPIAVHYPELGSMGPGHTNSLAKISLPSIPLLQARRRIAQCVSQGNSTAVEEGIQTQKFQCHGYHPWQSLC